MPGKETPQKAAAPKKAAAPVAQATEETVETTVGTVETQKDETAKNATNESIAAGTTVPQDEVQKAEEAKGAAKQPALKETLSATKAATAEEAQEGIIVNAKASKVKTVAINAMQNHSASIGGQQYELEKGRTYEVPEDVAAIFCNAFIAIKK